MSQPGLFDAPSLNVVADLKSALNRAARASHLSREQQVDLINAQGLRYGLSLRLGQATYDKWLNPADLSHYPSLPALPVVCAVLGDLAPLAVLARPLGAVVIGPEEQRLLAWARANRTSRRAQREMRRLEQEMERE